MATTYTVGIAGSTGHTRLCAEALRQTGLFEILWVLTPPPQPIGRKQVLTTNPLQLWAEEQNIAVIPVEKKIQSELKTVLQPLPDFLLVVDFGYLVPEWLLKWPHIAPLNIHPSLLPRWRGSSPGQFVLLYGEQTSAVTIMIMGAGLDTGPLLWQKEFAVDPTWNQQDYYQHSFDLAAKSLPEVMRGVATGQIQPIDQSEESPTPTAKRFKKDDGFVAWETVAKTAALPFKPSSELEQHHTSPLINDIQSTSGHSWSKVISDAVRALYPWPGVWTLMPTQKGLRRLKILEATTVGDVLFLKQVQLEGESRTDWGDFRSRLPTN